MGVLFWQTVVGGITAGSIYAAVAVGISLVYNVSRVLNLAQGEFLILGALSMITFEEVFHLPFWVALPLVVLVTAGLGLAMEQFAIQPARRASISVLLVITLATSMTLRGIAMLMWGKDPLAMPRYTAVKALLLGPVRVPPETVVIFAFTLVISGLLWLFLDRTPAGKAMRACAENPDAATMVGVDVRAMRRFSLVLCGAIGGVAGVLVAPLTFVVYDAGLLMGLKGFVAAMLGGLGRTFASIGAALVLGLAESMSAAYLSSQFKEATTFVILLVLLLVRSRYSR